ncbi:ATP-binding protein [Jiella pacifica]|mgnify:CR=1 FL=1|uniref:AAA family ATPase n=1 Tax=Jiella pacifica TaxID=2696469 RepID=A0A6N9T3B1_9HYPH|nr:ATP-binding protein [Jiella pacifica]NDW05864.1 AAA family ATPase [Jiella pacifica]
MARWNEERNEDASAKRLVSDALGGISDRLSEYPDDYRERLAAAKNVYIGDTERDAPVREAFRDLVDNALSQVNGAAPGPGEYLTLTGASGAGKSRLVARMLEKTDALAPIELENRTLRPIIKFGAPQPFTSGQAAIAILRAIGLETDTKMESNYAWQLVQNHLPRSKTSLIIVDDAQHALRHTKAEDVMTIRDAFKAITQYDPWPVSFFFVGIPVFKRFVCTDNQFMRRNTFVEIPRLFAHRDEALVRELVSAKLEAARLRKGFEDTEEFYARVIYAGGLEFGRCEKLVQLAIRDALRNGSRSLDVTHLADALRKATLVADDRNTFLTTLEAAQVIPQWVEESDEDFIAEDDILKATIKPRDNRKPRKP